MYKLAVYGTLRSRQGINKSWGGVLEDQVRLGEAVLPNEYAIFDLGSFPCVSKVEEPVDNPTVCEVYQVDERALAGCDRIEGHPDFYERRLVDIEGHGECYVYILDDHNGYRIASGDWYDK